MFCNNNAGHFLKLHPSILQTYDFQCVTFIDTNVHCNFYISFVALSWLDAKADLTEVRNKLCLFERSFKDAHMEMLGFPMGGAY